MNDLELFFNKGNKNNTDYYEYAASSKFKDANGNIIKWKLKKLSIDEYENVRKSCQNITGNTVTFDSELFMKKLIVESTVFPNLHDAKLQDSYGVKTPERLVTMLFDNVGDYYALNNYISNINGIMTASAIVENVKN